MGIARNSRLESVERATEAEMTDTRPSPLLSHDPASRAFAARAIARLEAQRTGRDSFDAWINYTVRQWRDFLATKEEVKS
jgi:hypothetical protein